MQYISLIIPLIAALFLGVIIMPLVLPLLKRLKFGQSIREDGPQSHLVKAGTPTMGGILFVLTTLVVAAFYVPSYPEMIPVMIAMFGFSIIGFCDDYIKVVKKRSLGLRAWQKFLAQILVTGILVVYMGWSGSLETTLRIPFSGGYQLELGYFAIPLMIFVVLATVNGVNLTDGIDGLASSVTIVVAVFFGAVSFAFHSQIEPITGALIGSLLAFLLWNAYPAKVFMGDTGSLALGGFVAMAAYITQSPLSILLVGIIFVIEPLSVIIQRYYFKATHGKRIFKMSPIHHHFELSGYSETRIVYLFVTVTILFGLLAWIGL